MIHRVIPVLMYHLFRDISTCFPFPISHPNLLFSIRMRTFRNRIRTFFSEFSDSEQKSPVQKKPIMIMHPIEERDPLPLFLLATRHKYSCSRPFKYSCKRAWLERYIYTFLCKTFDSVALDLLSLPYTFENSSKCIKTSFDSDSFLKWLKCQFHCIT